jgi:hypothetical protein
MCCGGNVRPVLDDTPSHSSPLGRGIRKGMLFTSRRDGRSHGRSLHFRLLSCRLSGSGHVRMAHDRVRSGRGQRHREEHRHGEAGPAERRSGRRRSDAAGGSHRWAVHHDGAAAVRSGRHVGRRSTWEEGSDDGSRHGEGCSREEGRDDHSSRPQEDHHGRRGHHSHGRGSLENGNGNGARADAGSRIEAFDC